MHEQYFDWMFHICIVQLKGCSGDAMKASEHVERRTEWTWGIISLELETNTCAGPGWSVFGLLCLLQCTHPIIHTTNELRGSPKITMHHLVCFCTWFDLKLICWTTWDHLNASGEGVTLCKCSDILYWFLLWSLLGKSLSSALNFHTSICTLMTSPEVGQIFYIHRTHLWIRWHEPKLQYCLKVFLLLCWTAVLWDSIQIPISSWVWARITWCVYTAMYLFSYAS